MNLSIHFNWPPPDSARVHMGSPNLSDKDWEFRIGVNPKDKKNIIYWVKPGWFVGENMKEIIFDVNRGDEVVVERKRKDSDKVETRNTWNIDEHWPAEAHGPSLTIIPWYF